jgi:predicted RNase H-like nuclease (RuvC/YqgF family)
MGAALADIEGGRRSLEELLPEVEQLGTRNRELQEELRRTTTAKDQEIRAKEQEIRARDQQIRQLTAQLEAKSRELASAHEAWLRHSRQVRERFSQAVDEVEAMAEPAGAPRS